MPDRSPTANLQSNITLVVPPPSITGTTANYQAVALYNNSADQCQVTYGTNTDILQPQTANVYPIPSSDYGVTVEPIDINATGTYIGTLQATWYRPGEQIPVFPFPLTVFPGGSFTIANGVSLGGGGANPTAILAPPIGSGVITVIDPLPGTFFEATPTLHGVQTGTQYAILGETDTEIQFTILNAIDTTFSLHYGVNPPLEFNIYAAPPTPVPSFASFATGRQTSFPYTLAAPEYGAWYLFGADAFTEGSGGALFEIVTNSEAIGELITENTAGTGSAYGGHIDLSGFRTTDDVVVSIILDSGASSPGFVLRFALGP